MEQVEKCIGLLKQHPYLYRESDQKKGVRRCVITKQVSLYYRVQDDAIQIITLTDNRQNPSQLEL
jgi:plasmid stabilization system protein ParE